MADFIEATKAVNNELACSGCGALLKFKPGTLSLVCEYCGAENIIAGPPTGEQQEISLEEYLARKVEEEETMEVATVKCESCGATSTLPKGVTSDKCPFCAAPLVVKTGTMSLLHKPQYVLPFGIDAGGAVTRFKTWLRKLWFAPNDLKHYADTADKLNGMYLPYWTFDCETSTAYSGQRGEYYYVTESYQATENGKTVTRTRQVRHTRWYPASGNVNNVFDDLLIEATQSVNKPKLRQLEPWDLHELMPYNDKFLSGFRTETYAVDVRAGYDQAKQRMEPEIENSICSDIGGDEQRINYSQTTYRNPTFKHILLPVWLSAYRYKGKVYQFLVNARTGEVQGERPYSAAKIALAVLGALVLLIVLYNLLGEQ